VRFEETPLSGAWVVELDRIGDERGYFARTFDRNEWRARGMDPAVVQCNITYNARAGTLRGMHFQAPPHGEPKLVRCTRGSIHDVIVDLRAGSATRGRWFGVDLTRENGRALYVPVDFAHGLQTLEADSEVLYMMGSEYVAEAASGVRWDDPAFSIKWPDPPAHGRTISDRDAAYPDYAV